MPKINNIHKEYLTEDEVLQIVAKARTQTDRWMIKLLFYSGCRISELLSVTPADIDFERQTLKLPALKRKDTEYKFAVLPSKLLPQLKAWCKGKHTQQRLFPISRQVAYGRVRIAAIQAGFQGVYPHLLRDSCATTWALKGGALTKLQRQLGHRSLSTTTDRYIKYSTADLVDDAEKVFK